MTVKARFSLHCNPCGTSLQLGDPTDIEALLAAASEKGWALALPAAPWADRQDLCPTCVKRAEVRAA